MPQVQLQGVVTGFRTQAKEQVQRGSVPDSLDVNRIHRTATAVQGELEEVERSGETPSLLRMPDPKTCEPGPIPWKAVIATLLLASQSASTRPDAKVVVPVIDAEDTIDAAIAGCEEVRRRVAQAIEGTKADPERAQQLRAHVFGGRPVPRSKPGWENELHTQIEAIRNLKEGAPVSLRRMVEKLQAALAQLEQARPLPPGRHTPQESWSTPVLEAATALNLCLSELLSWSASEATAKRNGALLRILTAKRQSDSGREAAAEAGKQEAEAPEQKTGTEG